MTKKTKPWDEVLLEVLKNDNEFLEFYLTKTTKNYKKDGNKEILRMELQHVIDALK